MALNAVWDGGTEANAEAAGIDADSGERTSLLVEVEGSDFEIEADLVLLALGFLHPQKAGLVEALGLELDPRGNIKTDANKMGSVEGVFAAGDAARGQSLIVWALSEGREAARCVDAYLMGESELPRSLSNAGRAAPSMPPTWPATR